MNSRSQTFELRVEGCQIDEAVACLFHTVLLHRTLGKFTFQRDGSYSVGTVGYEDVDCNFIDITYVCCSSVSLNNVLKTEISKFSNSLRRDSHGSGQISLEFFRKRKSHWPLFSPECIPWEVWNVRIELLKLCSRSDHQLRKETVGEEIGEKIIHIAEIMNRHEYTPRIPQQSELEFIFDTSYPDVQPYLFKLGYGNSDTSSSSMGYAFSRLLRETLPF
ncbi:hypothetical protein V9T40_010793 [Parthenolecanium corni]|uniref:Autophagy-related protein 101 n=1 Tax=Parthenolecanium corni TaxID=536013 RepID=A0AAN9T474_9HEMI